MSCAPLLLSPAGVLRLLSSLDPNVPMAISDHLWANFGHPSADAPRCLPCSYNLSSIRSVGTHYPYYRGLHQLTP